MAVLSPPSWGGWPPPCTNTRVSLTVDFGASGKFTLPWEREATGPLLRAAARIHARNADHADGIDPIPGGVYKLRMAGTYNCREITGGGAQSNHSWPLAIDLNWDTNPFHGSSSSWGPHDMPDYFVKAFEAEDFVWLGSFDPMHFEHLSHEGCAPIGQTGPMTVDWTVYRKDTGGGGFLMGLSNDEQEAVYAWLNLDSIERAGYICASGINTKPTITLHGKSKQMTKDADVNDFEGDWGAFNAWRTGLQKAQAARAVS